MTATINNDADMAPDENERPGPDNGNNSRAPLQRRSMVLSQAAEAGDDPIEPSWEMIAYASSREEPTNPTHPVVKGHNKRVRADLTPLPEEVLDDTDMNASVLAPPEINANGKDSQPRRSTRRNKVARMT